MANIRITSKDVQEYNRLMRNAKRKMKRLQKDGINLMGEIELPPLSAFETRKQFNEWKDFTEKFNKGLKRDYKVRTTDTGMKILQKEIDRYEEKEREAIRLGEEHYRESTPEHAILFRKPSRIDIPTHIPWQKLEKRNQFESRMEMLEKRASPLHFTERDLTFKNNFIASVEGSFNSTDLSREVIERLHRIDPKNLLQLFKHEDYSDVFTFEEYDSEGQIVGANENYLVAMNTVLKAVEEKGIENIIDRNDFLLKDFPDKV